MKLAFNGVEIDKFTKEDWNDLYKTLVEFSNRVATRHRYILHECRMCGHLIWSNEQLGCPHHPREEVQRG